MFLYLGFSWFQIRLHFKWSCCLSFFFTLSWENVWPTIIPLVRADRALPTITVKDLFVILLCDIVIYNKKYTFGHPSIPGKEFLKLVEFPKWWKGPKCLLLCYWGYFGTATKAEGARGWICVQWPMIQWIVPVSGSLHKSPRGLESFQVGRHGKIGSETVHAWKAALFLIPHRMYVFHQAVPKLYLVTINWQASK